jgi:hypothetical protein
MPASEDRLLPKTLERCPLPLEKSERFVKIVHDIMGRYDRKACVTIRAGAT